MELNENVIGMLKNYSDINGSIIVQAGNTLSSISEAKNVLSYTTLDVTFPQTFGIYDLNEFLNVLRLVDSPRLTFEQNYVSIGDSTGRSTIKYFFTDVEMITAPPLKENFTMPEGEVSFYMTNEVLARIKRAASALGHSELAVRPSNGVISLTVQDSENSTSNTFSIDVDGSYPEGVDFCLICNISNLKVVPTNYHVEISSKTISRFKAEDQDLEYYIAFEKSSNYGA